MYKVWKCSSTTGVNHSEILWSRSRLPETSKFILKNISETATIYVITATRALQMLMILIDINLIQKRQIFNKLATL